MYLWRHVPLGENPANISLRGLLPQDLVNCDLWWNGPHLLHSHPTIYPEQPIHIQPHKNIELKISANRLRWDKDFTCWTVSNIWSFEPDLFRRQYYNTFCNLSCLFFTF